MNLEITDEIIERWAKHGWTVEDALACKLDYELWSRDELSLFELDGCICNWFYGEDSAGYFAGWLTAKNKSK